MRPALPRVLLETGWKVPTHRDCVAESRWHDLRGRRVGDGHRVGKQKSVRECPVQGHEVKPQCPSLN